MQRLEKYLQKKLKFDAPYFIRGGFWNMFGQISIVLGGLAVSVLFTNKLSLNDYGVYKYIIGLGALLTSFSLTGTGQSIFQTAAQKYFGFYKEILKTNLIYSSGIMLASLAGSLYYLFNTNYILSIGCLLIAAFQPFVNLYQNIFPFLQGSKRFKESALSQLFKTIFVSLIGITSILLTQNILILIVTYLFANFIANFTLHLFYKPKNVQNIPNNIYRKYLNYAKHTSAREIISNLSFRLDTVIIFTQLGASEVAIYAIANLIPEQIKGSFKDLANLILSKYVNYGKIGDIKHHIPKRSLQLFLVFSGVAIIYALICPYVYKILFPKYETAILLSQLLALSFPASIAIIPNSALQSQLKNKELHILNIQSAIILLTLTITLIPLMGLVGAIIARITSRYSNLVLSYYHLYRSEN